MAHGSHTMQQLAQPVTDPLTARYAAVRAASVAICDGLSADDCQVQSMPEASPLKWHLAHTTWFFETFVLAGNAAYRPFHADFAVLFNSYYHGVGPVHPRPERGLISRPTLVEVHDYRAHVDAAVAGLLERGVEPALRDRVEVGLHHERQHQELMLTDLLHAFSRNELRPAYRAGALPTGATPASAGWLERPAGIAEIGHRGPGFHFDNEAPRHRAWLEAHALATRCVTNGEYRDFVRDGGYAKPALWLSDGWDLVQAQRWQRPLYWDEDLAHHFTLRGLQPLDAHAPACHLSYYEADAYARWAGARLPTEAEWEAAAADAPVTGNFVESGALLPRAQAGSEPDFFGNVWQWTASAYTAYPAYRPAAGALGEYNGKFMCNQWVLRGGSCASAADHVRVTYRNFFPPPARWQFSGLRLARDLR
jgi:ergothioneine biosynthesis protein EgtB